MSPDQSNSPPARRVRLLARAMRAHRRGIASVLSMMFLILFGSLIAAMSVASTGNIRTANMHQHVMRAIGAAETGLAVAEHRLNEASSRFVVAAGEVDSDLGRALWRGSSGDIGTHTVLPPKQGYAEGGLPSGIAEALVNIHASDSNIITGFGYVDTPTIQSAPIGTDTSVFSGTTWVNTPPVIVKAWANQETSSPPPAFRIQYAPLADGETIRVIVDGIVYDLTRNNQPIVRTISRDYKITKSIDQAILAHSRILIGKNVLIEGDLGTRYDETDAAHGDPVVMRSDFYGLDPDLDLKLDAFFAALAANDLDRDNRLRFGHPVEGAGLPSDVDLDGDTNPDGAYLDATGDGYLDDMDIFIRHYDTNGDNRVVLSDALTLGTPAETAGSGAEFEGVDEDLALLIDSAHADRNRNGVSGYIDTNSNNRYDADSEDPRDFDSIHSIYSDTELGWRDGYIDVMDQYAKTSGSLVFKATLDDWENNQGPVEERIHGTIIAGDSESPLVFGADDSVLPDITADSFVATESELMAAADGESFWYQVANQLGTNVGELSAWTREMNTGGEDDPAFIPVWADTDYDGLPDNWDWAYFEKAPHNSPSYSDIYWRPVFRNMVFRNVQIPMGLNGLFENCTFVGSTYVRTHTDNSHPLWQELGSNEIESITGLPVSKFLRTVYGDDAGEDASNAPPMLPASAVPPNQYILMTSPTISPLDKGDVPNNEISSYGSDYNLLPDPLVIDGLRITDTKAMSNNIRFHDTLFVGSIVSDTPVQYTQVRNKIQFTGATRFATVHPEEPDNGFLNPDEGDMDVIETSSMMLPNYSVDIGSFNSPPEQDVRLNGAVIAGVLDARGNTEINGALLLTFDPEFGEAPLVDIAGNPVGSPAGFNASLGYFGGGDGDFESVDPSELPLVGGVPIVGYDTDGDGIADVLYDQPQPPGSTPVPFNGFGRISIKHDPDMRLPSGLMLPLSMPPVAGTYHEGAY